MFPASPYAPETVTNYSMRTSFQNAFLSHRHLHSLSPSSIPHSPSILSLFPSVWHHLDNISHVVSLVAHYCCLTYAPTPPRPLGAGRTVEMNVCLDCKERLTE